MNTKIRYAFFFLVALGAELFSGSYSQAAFRALEKLPDNFLGLDSEWQDLAFSDFIKPSAYINPTEHNPQAAAAILKGAPNGIYFTVGTERAFIGAGQTPNVDHLVVVDVQQNAINYNLLNIALLQIAESRTEYLWLRRNAPPQFIAQLFTKVDVGTKTYLLDVDNWKWWQQIRQQAGFVLLEARPDDTGGLRDHAFRGANYLYNDIQFDRVAKLAKEGNTACVLVNLAIPTDVNSLVNKIKNLGLALAVLDITDLWYNSAEISFLKLKEITSLVQSFKSIATADSILLLTSWYGKFLHPNNLHKKPKIIYTGSDNRPEVKAIASLRYIPFWKWNYFGFSFKIISDPQDSEYLFRFLNADFIKFYQANPALAGTLNGQIPPEWNSANASINDYLDQGSPKAEIREILNNLEPQAQGKILVTLKKWTKSFFGQLKTDSKPTSGESFAPQFYCKEVFD
jgi:hypothetical protein